MMRKLLLVLLTTLSTSVVMAQHQATIVEKPVSGALSNTSSYNTSRTTAIGSHWTLSNILHTDSLTSYKYGTDSGYTTGPNIFGDWGFAERYEFNGTDSSVIVVGLMAQFAGKVNPASTNYVNFLIWDISESLAISSTLGYNGFPRNSADTLSVPVTNLGLGATKDTLKSFMFYTPDTLKYNFFIGYTINYDYTHMNGDTLGLACSKQGVRMHAPYTVVTVPPVDSGANTYDTLINVQNATLWSDNIWRDNYTQNDSIYNDLAIFPIVQIGAPSGVPKITRNNLSLYGCYPNPANSNTNIKFGLSQPAGVTILITDMSGRTLIEKPAVFFEAGEHTTSIGTENLPSANYLYLIRTSSGDGIAGKLTITK